MLVIWLPDDNMNFEILLLPIETMICFLERLFVVMLIQGFFFLSSLIDLWISLILDNDACIYDCLSLLVYSIDFLLFFWWNFDLSKSSLEDLGRTGNKILEISAGLVSSFFFSGLLLEILDILCIKNWVAMINWLILIFSF